MKQAVRLNTFETNSSSMHSLILVNKDDFNNFKQDKLFYYTGGECFKSYDEIPTLIEFKNEYPEVVNETDQNKIDKLVQEFIDEYFNGDYAYGYDASNLDYIAETVYDKDGNEQIAFSIYIPG